MAISLSKNGRNMYNFYIMRKILLCRPIYFRVDYEINPWMKIGSVNQQIAIAQWENLVSEYKKLNLNVEIIEQDQKFPDMVFATDQGVLIKDKEILLSRFRYLERRGESEYYKQWYEDHGYKIKMLPNNIFFEGGGELQHWRDNLLIGFGFRTDQNAINSVEKIFNKNCIKLELIDKRFYHLDTCLMVLNNDVIFYYPQAFSSSSIQQLKSIVPNLLKIEYDEVVNFAANSIVFGSTVFIQEGNIKMSNQMTKLGYKVIPVNVGEFIKAGGGAHCLTGDLGEI